MKKRKLFLKWTFIFILSLLLAYFVILLYVKSEVNHHSGENTDDVNILTTKNLEKNIAIRNIDILSEDSDSMIPDQNVLIKDHLIEAIETQIEIPEGYHIVDGQGKFLIPGLVDTHAHPYKSENDLLLYLTQGVTYIATMNSKDGLYLQWKQDILDEKMLSPKLFICAGGMSTKTRIMSRVRMLFGDKAYNTPEQARAAVKKFKEMGYDGIKSYSPSKEVFNALTDEAKKLDIPVVGHITPSITLDEFFASSQSQVAHVEEIMKAAERDFYKLSRNYYDSIEGFLPYFKSRVDDIAKKLKERNVVVSSTVWIIESIPKQDFDLPNFLKTIKLEYENPGVLEGSTYKPGWFPGSNKYEFPDNTDPESKKVSEIFWSIYIEAIHEMTRALVRHGVVLTTGTDSIGWGAIPGFSMHDEMESLNNLGLSEKEVLHASTLAPAHWMQTNGGKIEIGKDADLLILNKNPLDNISNIKDINAVIANGQLLDRSTLDLILAHIKKVNNESRKTSIDPYVGNTALVND